jgi:hypothetical protein
MLEALWKIYLVLVFFVNIQSANFFVDFFVKIRKILVCFVVTKRSISYWYFTQNLACTLGYNEFDFFLENKEYRPFDGCKIEI